MPSPRRGRGPWCFPAEQHFYRSPERAQRNPERGQRERRRQSGPLGQGTAPVVSGEQRLRRPRLLYTGTGATTNRAFTLGAGTCGRRRRISQSTSSLGLNGVIDGNGGLTKTGSGMLTLGGSNLYTGTTTVSAGTLAIGPGGSINASSDLSIGQGSLLQVTARDDGWKPVARRGQSHASAAEC